MQQSIFAFDYILRRRRPSIDRRLRARALALFELISGALVVRFPHYSSIRHSSPDTFVAVIARAVVRVLCACCVPPEARNREHISSVRAVFVSVLVVVVVSFILISVRASGVAPRDKGSCSVFVWVANTHTHTYTQPICDKHHVGAYCALY